jgi:hypothetical protein
VAGELFVDVAGVNALYNQLRDAGDDAEHALGYVRRHGDLNLVQQGLMVQALTPHEIAYHQMTTALSRLHLLSRSAATQVNIAQVEYSREDLRAAADLDAGFHGAADPNVLASSLAQERLRLPAGHFPFSDVGDPESHLAAPQDPEAEFWSFNPMVDLLSPFAYLRQAAIWVFNHDPFELWTEWFAGDWDAYVKAGDAVARAGAAAGTIGDNLAAGAVSVPLVWRGNAAEDFQEYELKLATAARSINELGRILHSSYRQSADCVKNFYEVISGFIVKMFDALLMVSIGLASGTALIATLAGSVIGYSVALSYALYAVDLYNDMSKAFTHAENALKAIAGAAASVEASTELMDLPAMEPYRHPGN